jgi:hypothetical protein
MPKIPELWDAQANCYHSSHLARDAGLTLEENSTCHRKVMESPCIYPGMWKKKKHRFIDIHRLFKHHRDGSFLEAASPVSKGTWFGLQVTKSQTVR